MLSAILATLLCGALVGWWRTARKLVTLRREARAVSAEIKRFCKAHSLFEAQ